MQCTVGSQQRDRKENILWGRPWEVSERRLSLNRIWGSLLRISRLMTGDQERKMFWEEEKKPAHTRGCDIGNSQQFSRVRAEGWYEDNFC